MPLQGGVFVCPASFHGRESACGISLGLPTDVICLAQSTQRTQRYLVGCRASMNGCRCEMAYGYRAEDAPSPSVIPCRLRATIAWNLLGLANRCHISRAEDAEDAEVSCWLSCADKWLSMRDGVWVSHRGRRGHRGHRGRARRSHVRNMPMCPHHPSGRHCMAP